jgi:hypothetical protein
MRRLPMSVAVVGILLAGCSARCATVTLDAAAKKAASDTALIEPQRVRSLHDQLGVYIRSKSLTAQSVMVKIPGLTQERFDVYVNWGAFSIKRAEEMSKSSGQAIETPAIEPGYVIRDESAAELANGLVFEIPGRVVPAALMRCVESAQPGIGRAYAGLRGSTTGDPGRAANTLGQAADWVRSAIGADEMYRSVQLFVVAAGVEPKEMDWGFRYTAKGTQESVGNACSLLHKARVRMYDNLKDPVLRETVVEALTPVEVDLRYSAEKGIPRVTFEITNNCNLSAAGTIDVSVPKGWKTQPEQCSFAGVGSGATYTGSLRLSRTIKNQPVPSTLSALVTVKVADAKTFAKLRIQRNLALQSMDRKDN